MLENQPKSTHSPIIILIRSVFIWISIVLITIVLGLIASLGSLTKSNSFINFLANIWARTIAFVSGFRMNVKGRENLPQEGPALIIANHQGMVDIISLYVALPLELSWMAKQELFHIPIVGWCMTGAGFIPVERNDKKKSMHSLFEAAHQFQNSKRTIVVFPEGTRSFHDGKMKPFKKGGFILAKKAGVPVLPITMNGSAAACPTRQKKIFPRIYPGEIIVTIHKPLAPEEYNDLTVEELSSKVRAIIETPL